MSCSEVAVAVFLGLLQGVLEWLPVSSGSFTASFHALICGGGFASGLEYALWLHGGTAMAALLALRREAAAVVRGVVASPWPLPPVAAFLLWSAAMSGVVGLPLVLVGVQAAGFAGPAVMGLGGTVLLMAGAAQLRLSDGGLRSAHAARRGDALLAGLAQGVSVVPGLSRSGLATAALLARGFRGRDALALSFLMSVPAGLGGALYAGISGGAAVWSLEWLAGLVCAFWSGLLTVGLLLRLAARLNFGWAALAAGALLLAGSAWRLWG